MNKLELTIFTSLLALIVLGHFTVVSGLSKPKNYRKPTTMVITKE